MTRATFTGRLCRAPEMVTDSIAEFVIEVKQRTQGAVPDLSVTVSAKNKLARVCIEKLSLGRLVLVDGELETTGGVNTLRAKEVIFIDHRK